VNKTNGRLVSAETESNSETADETISSSNNSK